MPGRIGLVVIHGMGAQQKDFADALMADVLSRVGADASGALARRVHDHGLHPGSPARARPECLHGCQNLVALVTFGCNIPLFSLDFDVATPIDLPGPGITKQALIDASRWLNFLDRDACWAGP